VHCGCDRHCGYDTAREETAVTGANSALDVARTYYDAWTGKDIDTAMACLADDVICDAPAGRIEGVAAYRAFLEPFAQILLKAELLAAFGDETTAVLVYDTATIPVPSGPGAECLTVQDGKITYNRFIFDRTPFDAARRAAG
jgi:ketosteroid isomerase-like protein